MNAAEVQNEIERQVGGDAALRNSHGINISRSLVKPEPVTIIDRNVKNGRIVDRSVSTWLVLVEDLEDPESYRIVYDANDGLFGLASRGLKGDKHLVVSGWYRDFMSAFLGM